jgi:lambda family phage portal protein
MPEVAPPVPWIDRTIAWWSPVRGMRRARARLALQLLRAYEGAAVSRRTEGWRTAATSGNAELLGAVPRLRDRSRDHCRNNSWGKRAVGRLTTEVVGFGIQASFSGKNKRNVTATEKAWTAWAGALTCDVRGRHDFGGLQWLTVRTLFQSGAALVRRVWDADAPLGLRLQVLEPDYLWVSPWLGPAPETPGNRVVGGIEVNRYGEAQAYHVLPRHPGDPGPAAGVRETTRVPASEMIHLYVEDRPEDLGGVPLLAAVLVRLRDLDEYADAQVVRQKIAACFAMFFEEPEGGTSPIFGPTKPWELPCDRVEPGMMEKLPAGTTVTANAPPGVQGYDEFMTRELQGVGAGTGIPYEDLTGDYSKVNFSSARMGRAMFYALVEEVQWLLVVPNFLQRVWGWFRDAAVIAGVPVDGVDVEWTMPRKTLVDPAREIPAVIRQVRAGLMSPQEAMRELGYDPDRNLGQWKAFTDIVDQLGLILDIDPRRTTLQGAAAGPAQAVAAADGGDGGDEPPPAPPARGVPPRVNGHAAGGGPIP